MASKNAAIEPNGKSAALKERAIREFKLYWIVVLYLWLFLGSFTVYRRLVVAEAGAAYLNYGIAVIEALVIAKVVLIGRMFGFSRRFEDSPLIVPVIYKTILFSILVLLFGVAENTVRLSVGIEPVDQLIDDLGQALVHAGSEKGSNP